MCVWTIWKSLWKWKTKASWVLKKILGNAEKYNLTDVFCVWKQLKQNCLTFCGSIKNWFFKVSMRH